MGIVWAYNRLDMVNRKGLPPALAVAVAMWLIMTSLWHHWNVGTWDHPARPWLNVVQAARGSALPFVKQIAFFRLVNYYELTQIG